MDKDGSNNESFQNDSKQKDLLEKENPETKGDFNQKRLTNRFVSDGGDILIDGKPLEIEKGNITNPEIKNIHGVEEAGDCFKSLTNLLAIIENALYEDFKQPGRLLIIKKIKGDLKSQPDVKEEKFILLKKEVEEEDADSEFLPGMTQDQKKDDANENLSKETSNGDLEDKNDITGNDDQNEHLQKNNAEDKRFDMIDEFDSSDDDSN